MCADIGILAYGSLILEPGEEIDPLIIKRHLIRSPVKVEYGRFSEKRNWAPTLVPHPKGAYVTAQFLMLNQTVTVEEATTLLWRREARKIGSGEPYVRRPGKNCVIVEKMPWNNITLLYTDFNDSGKDYKATAADLASKAIRSVTTEDCVTDGITYLSNAINCGIITPLTEAYVFEILAQTGTNNLTAARLECCRLYKKETRHHGI